MDDGHAKNLLAGGVDRQFVLDRVASSRCAGGPMACFCGLFCVVNKEPRQIEDARHPGDYRDNMQNQRPGIEAGKQILRPIHALSPSPAEPVSLHSPDRRQA